MHHKKVLDGATLRKAGWKALVKSLVVLKRYLKKEY